MVLFSTICINQVIHLARIPLSLRLFAPFVCAVTLGLVLALEEPEPDVMVRKPRDPKQPILDAFTAYRTVVVTAALVVAMLGNQEWHFIYLGDRESPSALAQGRAVAMTTLVIGQATYAINCRFVHGAALSPMAWLANKWVAAMIALNAGLQCFLLYTPKVHEVWEMDPIDAHAWGRVILLAFAIYWFVEFEKIVGYKYMYPLVKPALTAVFGRGKKQTALDRLNAAAGQTSASTSEAEAGAAHGGAKPAAV